MPNRYKLWENASLAIGGLGVAIVVIGLGYTLSDRVINSITQGHQEVNTRQINKPLLVKSDTIHHVRIDLNGNTDDIRGIQQLLSDKGYEVYIPKELEVVQVGAFRDRRRAEALVKKLETDGLDAKIE